MNTESKLVTLLMGNKQLLQDFHSLDKNLDPNLIDLWSVADSNKMSNKELQKKIATGRIKEISGIRNLYSEFIEGVRSEYQKCATDLKDLSELTLTEFKTKKGFKTVVELLDFMFATVIRCARLSMIINPRYDYMKSKNSRTKEDYEMIKIYWVDDHGTVARTINKNIGNATNMDIQVAGKLLQYLGFQEIEINPNNGFDLSAIESNQRYNIEVKLHNRKRVVESIVRVHLWLEYKTIYGV